MCSRAGSTDGNRSWSPAYQGCLMGKMLQTGCSSYLDGLASNGRIDCSASCMPVNKMSGAYQTDCILHARLSVSHCGRIHK